MQRRFDPAGSDWRLTPAPVWSAVQKDWLTRGGSLTAHLRGVGAVRVEVTREAVDVAWRDEVHCLRLAAREPVWTREVVLRVDGVPMVAAHSIVPLRASRGIWQAIRRLRTRPLAELLYGDATVWRSGLTSRRIGARHPLYRLACATGSTLLPSLPARRSVFSRQGVPLLVTECFLPALWARLAESSPTPVAGA